MISLKLVDLKKCYEDSVKLTLLDYERKINFTAGQFITIILNQKQDLFKSFSIASSPEELPRIEVAFRLKEDDFSNYIKNCLTIDETIFALPPEGELILDKKSAQSYNVIFFAIGSGVTPIYSILKTELKKSSNLIFYLILGNRNTAKAFYWNEILEFEQNFPHKFRVFNFFTEEKTIPKFFQGRITQKSVSQILASQNIELINTDFFISGSSVFVKDISKFLFSKNISRDKIHIEKYNFVEIKSKIEREFVSSKK